MTDENPSGRPDKFSTRGRRGPEKSARRKASEAAGISKHQMYRALAVASIPKEEFEALIESDNPPTIEELANIGKRKSQESKTATPFDRLRRAWNAASEADRLRLLREVGVL